MKAYKIKLICSRGIEEVEGEIDHEDRRYFMVRQGSDGRYVESLRLNRMCFLARHEAVTAGARRVQQRITSLHAQIQTLMALKSSLESEEEAACSITGITSNYGLTEVRVAIRNQHTTIEEP